MISRQLPPLPPKKHRGRQRDPIDLKNHQDPNHISLLSRAGVNLKRHIRRGKTTVDQKAKSVEDNENREARTLDGDNIIITSTHHGEDIGDTLAFDGKGIIDIRALDEQEIREARTNDEKETKDVAKLDGEATKDMTTLDGGMKALHDPEGTDWKTEYETKVKEPNDLHDDFDHLKHEHYDCQQEIRKRALTFEREFEDPLYSLLRDKNDFGFAIQTLLDNYECRIKERANLKCRYQSEHNRCIEKDNALKVKDQHFQVQWVNNETTLRAQHDEERTNAYKKGAADERSSWTESWENHQDELARQSLQLKDEQAKRRALETKVEFLETQVATAKSELSERDRTLGTLRTLRENLENANRRLVSEMSILEEKQMSQISKLKTIEEAHEEEMERLENEHEAEISNIKGKAETLKQNHTAELKRQENRHAQEILNLSTEIVSLKETHTEALKSKDANHSTELSKAQERITALKESHVMDLQNRGKAHIGAISKLEARMSSLSEKHAIELRTRSITNATELTARDQIHAEEELKWRGKLESLKIDHSAVLKNRDETHATATSKLKKQFRDHLAQREKEHADITKALRVTVGDYSGALLERDKITYNMIEGKPFEPLLDAEIEARFIGLAEEVDTLSRLDWKANPSGWPEPVLLRLSRNQKTLKRQILKDTIWVVLHEYVFCSPFRVFGDEGRALESKWNDECGADDDLDNGLYVWPKPSMKTERWRYITIRECRAALQKPIPSPYDPLAKLRKDFQATIRTVKDELTSAVGDLVALNQTNIQDLEKMALRAARTWLEFGLQRYRVMVQMQGDKIKLVGKSVERLHNRPALVVAPRLERFGNAKGEDLDIKEIIGELEGEIVTLKL